MKLIEKEKFGNGYKITLFGIFKIKHKAKKTLTEEQQIFEECYNKERFIQKDMMFKGYNITVPDMPSFAYQVKEIWQNEIYKFNIFIEYHSIIGQPQLLDKILVVMTFFFGGGVRLFSYNNMDLQVNIWGYKQNE